MEGSFKINFNGDTRGNLGKSRFGGVVYKSRGELVGIMWGYIRVMTNNVANNEGLINGVSWVMRKGWIPVVVEGEYQVILNMEGNLGWRTDIQSG